jgi:hypothetical protein
MGTSQTGQKSGTTAAAAASAEGIKTNTQYITITTLLLRVLLLYFCIVVLYVAFS